MTDDGTPRPGQAGDELPPERPSASTGAPIGRRGTDLAEFDPRHLDRRVIAIPLQRDLDAERAGEAEPRPHKIIIELNLTFPGGRDQARRRVRALIESVLARPDRRVPFPVADARLGVNSAKSQFSHQYVFATLDGEAIRELVRIDGARETSLPAGVPKTPRAIFRIWPDFPVHALTMASIRTIKADAARISFSALGEDIVWAVLDSGIDGKHPHFEEHKTLKVAPPLRHRDFTGSPEQPLVDEYGHGTHVAGIIAGELTASRRRPIWAVSRQRDEEGNVSHVLLEPESMAGMAPRTKLVSMRVLDASGDGEASNLIAAIEAIQQINGYGRRLRIHGVNLSVGYTFDPEWFACGQSPLCVEIDRLVRSGVVVVAAAGNTGYGWAKSAFKGLVPAGVDLTINDPGNAELAITVGSTHRESPHVYGVSYFSSKGPTGDGRLKPDLVAPGEKIVSCATGALCAEIAADYGAESEGKGLYIEDSGTSMAAPHVSGVIAAFLSVRREFIGRPEAVKQIFLSTATDLKRERTFQGHGLVDLMRAIQSV